MAGSMRQTSTRKGDLGLAETGENRAGDKGKRRDTAIGRCPICQQPTIVRYRPFCSRRCADIDLSRWLGGRYAIAGGNVDEDEDGDDSRAANSQHMTEREPGDGS